MHSYLKVVMALSCGVGAALLLPTAHAGTMVEDLIAQENPCKQLKTQLMGSSIGVDKLKRVKVNSANIALNGDHVKLDLSGSLACETGPGSAMVGDASADLKASASASLADCKVSAVSVVLSNFGGSFRDLLSALQQPMQENLKQEIKAQLVKGCQDFRAGLGTKSASR